MILAVLPVLATVAAARAEIAYSGGLTVLKGPLSSCSFSQNYNPASPLYNQVVPPWPGKYPLQRFYKPSALQTVGISNPSPVCNCGCMQNFEGSPLVAGPQTLGGPPLTLPVPISYSSEYATQELSPSPTVSLPPIPPAPDPPRISPIMKIPRKSDSITITVNSSDSPPSTVSSNSVYSYPSQPPSFFPSRRLYTRPPPLLASCPAAVFYPATISYSPYPPLTCPAQPPSTTPTNITPPIQTTQSVLVPSTPPTITVTGPKDDGKPIASFTTNIPDIKFPNASTKVDKRDPLLTFKLLSAAAAKNKEVLSSAVGQTAPSTDCSMPLPPTLL